MTQPGVPLRDAFLFWLKLGFISFGGPAGQIAIMHRELVEKKRWISEARFLHALNYCMLLPGPEAQQLATYLGWLMHRTAGGLIAGVLFVLPALLLLIALSWVYLAWGTLPLVAGVLAGIKPAVVAIVVQAIFRIGARTLHNAALWAIAGAAFLAMFVGQLPFPLIIALAALAGFVGARFSPDTFSLKASHGKSSATSGPALIDDDTPTPPHARHHLGRLLRVAITGLTLWALPMAGLTVMLGWQHVLTQMGWFFSKAALLTFGGAYAVLPYVYQGAVTHYGWLTAGQMIDGLALGETTPGPLIMVVTFVGFVGGHTLAPFGSEHGLLSAIAAALVVTYFTFLPSFIFIFAGGPLVESTHRKLAFTAPLTAITAAVVGVIGNLAVFFAQHVIAPEGQPINLWAAMLALLAAVALIKFKRGVIELILSAAVLGLVVNSVAG